ncbi:MAG: Smr/MutS family protein [Candidatus Eisenbacteria bacterium]
MSAVKTNVSECRWSGAGTFAHVAGSGAAYSSDALLSEEPARPLKGPSPMEMLLGAVCGCMGVDIVSILSKMKVDLRELSLAAEGERSEEYPRVFRQVRITCRVVTDPPDPRKVQRAVELSAGKYCAASATLASAGEVRYRVLSGGQEFEGVIEGVGARAAAGAPAQDPEFADSLDLHAFHPRDTAVVVEEYLREARARGLREVRIIHGKGLGVQQRNVAAVLDRHPDVESHQLAPADRGHYGATIVRLRPAAAANP